MKSILSLILILSMLFLAVACNRQVPPEAVPYYINGVDISEYVITYDEDSLDYNKRAAEYIHEQIRELTGYILDIVDDSEAAAAHEIVVGETSRPISKELDEDTKGFEFAMLAKDGSIALEGDYFVIAAAAYYLIDTYFGDGNTIEIPDGLTVREPVTKKATNLIMLIGDGMGVYQTQLFDHLEDTSGYSDGETEFYGYMFPYQGFSRTSSFSGVTDSAAGGTALATGYKTYNEYVGLDKDGNRIQSLTELAAELGKATAVMSTENNTGATPASFSAHAPNRDNSTNILADQVALTMTYGTIFDCGYDYYTARYIKVIENHITDTLTKLDADEDGFFLMYEEAHIDKKSAKNDIDGTFLALIRFNQALACFMEFAFYHPDTAVIITADHETGGLHPDGDGSLSYVDTEHTAANVPVFAWGVGMDFFNGKTVENIDIPKHLASLWGVEDFGDRSSNWFDAIYGDDKEYLTPPDSFN